MLAIASMAASERAASSASSGPPQAAPARAFPCGSAITGHIASSSPHDQIHPSISTVSCSAHNITVSYAISSPYRDEGIPAPFGPTPPTALLIDAGKIVASQVTQPQAIPSGTVNGQDAQFAFVGKIPYRDALTFSELCPGMTWRHPSAAWPDRFTSTDGTPSERHWVECSIRVAFVTREVCASTAPQWHFGIGPL